MTAINSLADLGFEAIDNMPLTLLPRLFDGAPLDNPIALGIDVRNRDFSAERLLETFTTLTADPTKDTTLLYLDCRPDVLLRRYSETRRKHPLTEDESPAEGIAQEVAILKSIYDRADIMIDTSELSPHELRAKLEGLFAADDDKRISISVQSFSYKRGLPAELDTAFDVRFLANPHWDPALRSKDGRDPAVSEFVENDPKFDEFYAQLETMIVFLLPAYAEEGKSHFSIGIGCTGGQHRSVSVAEKLTNTLAETGWRVSIRHRELERREKIARESR
jgi:UPF0042 nucleotide-binding protein